MSINARNVRMDAHFTHACMTPLNDFDKWTKEKVISLMSFFVFGSIKPGFHIVVFVVSVVSVV